MCVDDHPLVLEAMKSVLAGDDFELVGLLNGAEDLIGAAQQAQPHVILLDILMPGPDVFAAVEDLGRQVPDARVIMHSAFIRDHYIDAAVNAGAWGYACKCDSIKELLEGICAVAKGSFFFSSGVVKLITPRDPNRQAGSGSPVPTLTTREQEVLRLIGRGMSRAEIAQTLARSPNTVTGHTQAIMKKLAISSRVGLVRYAIAEGLAEPSQT